MDVSDTLNNYTLKCPTHFMSATDRALSGHVTIALGALSGHVTRQQRRDRPAPDQPRFDARERVSERVRERVCERERVCVCVCEREREREKEKECVCVCVRERGRVCV